jgi:hypothetical protein
MRKKIAKILGIFFLILLSAVLFFYFRYKPVSNPQWGLTFSYQEAKGLGFDPRQMYLDVLSDLKPKNLRLMTYWNDIEKTRGQFDFSNVDWMLNEAEKNHTNVILVVGRKQPRWPECHEPDWFSKLSNNDQDSAVLDFAKAEIQHFKSSATVKYWQVENEPYFGFGASCPVISNTLFNREVALVKQLDTRPVIVTDSGDRGGWIPVMKSGADDFGFTLYRVSYDKKYGGYYKYPLPAVYYRIRAGILKTFTHTDQVMDVELQMEPWFTQGALNTPLDLQKSLMNSKVFAENVAYAQKTGASAHYLWGVEWWYWMAKKQNDWGMWAAAKDLLAGK